MVDGWLPAICWGIIFGLSAYAVLHLTGVTP